MRRFTFYIQARAIVDDGSHEFGIPVDVVAEDAKSAARKMSRALEKLAEVPEHHVIETRLGHEVMQVIAKVRDKA